VVLRSGERRRYELAAGHPQPDPVDLATDEVTALEVWLSQKALQALTIVDTPGFDVSGPDSAPGSGNGRSESEPSGTHLALRRADALLFVMAGDTASSDREALEAFHRRFEGAGRASAVNAIGVLAKADLTDPEGVSWRPALQRANSLREVLGSLVTAVIPVATRIAETADVGELSDADVDALSRWSQLSPNDRERLLSASGHDEAAQVSSAERDRLIGILGRYGVRLALELSDSGDEFNQVTLNRRLREQSGLDELRRQIDGLQLRSDALKADAALSALESLSWRCRLPSLRDEIDRIRLDAPVLELVRLFDDCASGKVELGAGKLEELEHLLTGRTLAERLQLSSDATRSQIQAIAAQRAREWKTWAVGGLASFQGQQVANKVDDVYMQIAFPD
jgi:hypothetical protein